MPALEWSNGTTGRRPPYQRVLPAGFLDRQEHRTLKTVYLSLNPALLRQQIQEALNRLWKLADRARR